jgi:hypothetical protein
MSSESYDSAYARGLREGQGTQNPSPPPKPDNLKQAHESGKAAGGKSK